MKKTFLLLVSIVLLHSCNKDNDDTPQLPTENAVKLATNASLGKILTDSAGKSLYFFSKDTKETSVCIDGCIDIWPVFYTENLTIDTGLDLADFATITRTDGAKQTTYKGWPLYYFANDVKAGVTKGDKVNNIWYVAKPDYSLMYVTSQLKGHDDKNYTSQFMEGIGATPYIVDIDGRTLYTFSKDTKNTNTFTKSDFSNNGVWPIAEITLDKIPSILNNNDFGTIDVFGKTQITYKGWPLYYFGQDTARGDNKGISFPAPGVWPIANVDTSMAPDATVTTVVKLSDNATFGKILTDSEGKSLYFFSKDTKETSVCLDGCRTIWPIFYGENLAVDLGLDVADFETITRTDGAKQTTYKGWPLYYFANDASAGDTNGDKVNNVWYVAKPDYSLMYVTSQLKGHDDKNYTSDYSEGDGNTFYMTDIDGRTLYTFSHDTNNVNNFTNSDFSNNGVWPIAEISLDQLPSILNSSDFGTIDVFGKTQITYKGWPLYYFGQDTARGDNKGISFPAPGVWPIANVNTTTAPAAKTIKLADNATFGKIITDSEGKSLYFFSDDAKNTSVCVDGCLNIWPIFYSENPVVDSGLDIADFATITRTDGAKQTTYKGWPLYYYAGDGNIGETLGDNVGNEWFIAKPDYSLMYVNAQLVGHDGKNYTSQYMEGIGETSYIVDIDGRTLYTFSHDTNNVNNFTNSDFSNNGVWPIAEISLDKIPTNLNTSDFGTIDVFGKTQLTYKGWPLYYFGQDAIRGDNKGISFPAPGVWPIANVDTTTAPTN